LKTKLSQLQAERARDQVWTAAPQRPGPTWTGSLTCEPPVQAELLQVQHLREQEEQRRSRQLEEEQRRSRQLEEALRLQAQQSSSHISMKQVRGQRSPGRLRATASDWFKVT